LGEHNERRHPIPQKALSNSLRVLLLAQSRHAIFPIFDKQKNVKNGKGNKVRPAHVSAVQHPCAIMKGKAVTRGKGKAGGQRVLRPTLESMVTLHSNTLPSTSIAAEAG
jgi:hypothetical protein